jgi:hypothetical protein
MAERKFTLFFFVFFVILAIIGFALGLAFLTPPEQVNEDLILMEEESPSPSPAPSPSTPIPETLFVIPESPMGTLGIFVVLAVAFGLVALKKR